NSRARSTTTTTATLRDLTAFQAGSLTLAASGVDTNFASALAGTGGVVAGTASKAQTPAHSTTRAVTDTSSESAPDTLAVPQGQIPSAPTHTATFGGWVDSTQASLVGASGARLNHAVAAAVDALLGDWAIVRAADLAISARNLTHNFFIGEAAFGL